MQIQDTKNKGVTVRAVPTHKPAVAESGNFFDHIVPQKSDNGFDSLGPHAPMTVKLAWNRASEQTGVNGLGLGQNGMMTHISAALIVQAEQTKLRGSSDLFGNNVDSAKGAAMKILGRLDNPVIPETNTKIRELHDKERAFYKAFIKNLDEINGSAYDTWEGKK